MSVRSVTKAVLTECVLSRSRALAEQRGRGDVILTTPTPLPGMTSVLSRRDFAGEGEKVEEIEEEAGRE